MKINSDASRNTKFTPNFSDINPAINGPMMNAMFMKVNLMPSFLVS